MENYLTLGDEGWKIMLEVHMITNQMCINNSQCTAYKYLGKCNL